MTDDELLTPKPFATNESLQAQILRHTVRRVRLAAWQRRAIQVATALLCFGLGWAMSYLRPDPPREVVVVEVPVGPAAAVADVPGATASPKDAPAPAES